MIEVIVDEQRTGEEILDALDGLVLAHRVIRLDEHSPSPLPSGVALPAIREGDRIIDGQADIAAFLLEFEAFAAAWSKFQSDTCYLDDDGTVC
jgi:hypothetical protein